jgi:CYTH domain-containing protein
MAIEIERKFLVKGEFRHLAVKEIKMLQTYLTIDPVEDAKEMMSICLPGKIVKSRFLIPAGKHTWEVDVFHDKNEGLVIAEIELKSEDESFEKPEWLGDEVTGKREYYNAYLIK